MGRLALAMGVWDVPRLLDSMTAETLDWWSRYWAVEPWGELRADQRAAAQAMWNTAPYAAEGTDLPSLEFPYFRDDNDHINERIKALEEAKHKWLSQSQNSQSISPPKPAE